jgi:hypothetical protein
MIHHHYILAALATERQTTLLAEAQAARQPRQNRPPAAPASRLVRVVRKLRPARRARHAVQRGRAVTESPS